jgi:hypothetical protein
LVLNIITTPPPRRKPAPKRKNPEPPTIPTQNPPKIKETPTRNSITQRAIVQNNPKKSIPHTETVTDKIEIKSQSQRVFGIVKRPNKRKKGLVLDEIDNIKPTVQEKSEPQPDLVFGVKKEINHFKDFDGLSERIVGNLRGFATFNNCGTDFYREI